MPQIDCYITLLSPYVYLAGPRFAQIVTRHAAKVRFMPLHFGSLAARMGSTLMADASEARRDWYAQDLARQAKKQGLQINTRPLYWPTNPAPASYAVIAAQAAVDKGATGDLAGWVHGFGAAVWAQERNIADDDEVRRLLVTHGFEENTADRGMLTAAETYAGNLESAASRGVFGVPFYIVDDQKFWGQDRLDDLDHYLAGKS